MLKNILKLNGAQELSQKQQQSINGGASCSAICARPWAYPINQCLNCNCGGTICDD